jgi:hypothetical protein
MWFWMLSLALADDPKFEETDKALTDEPVKEDKLSAELGGAYTTGNTDFWTFNSTVNAAFRRSSNKLGVVAGAVTGKSVVDADGDGIISDLEKEAGRVRNAQRLFVDARYDRFLGEKQSVYVLAGAFVDPFAGYDLRSHEQFGYSRVLVDSESTNLLAELGADYAQENYVTGVDPNTRDIIAARALIGFKHTFNDAVSFQDTVEVYENVLDLEDLRVLNKAAITSKLSEKLSLKLSHDLIFDNQPVEGFRKLDQTTMVTVVATML